MEHLHLHLCNCRTPQGVRGLKLNTDVFMNLMLVSHSARSAWIETQIYFWHRARLKSHSARSAWIETHHWGVVVPFLEVALRKECVD